MHQYEITIAFRRDRVPATSLSFQSLVAVVSSASSDVCMLPILQCKGIIQTSDIPPFHLSPFAVLVLFFCYSTLSRQ